MKYGYNINVTGDRCVKSISRQRDACRRALYKALFQLLAASLTMMRVNGGGGA
jgi:hypothetical protein